MLIEVLLTATCVLARPNPIDIEQIQNTGITFFGDGIVPGDTSIKIYSLSGNLVADLPPGTADREITWKPMDITAGIYIYIYNSSREQGIGKFTVIR